MTANQVQIRRDSATNIAAATGANGEIFYDTTNKRLVLNDGTTLGGIWMPNKTDLLNQSFISSDATGTNTITMTVTPIPAAYVKYQRYVFKAAATNTGATTINVNSLGAKTVKKRTTSGVADLVGGEIQQDGIYGIVYDGTNLQLEDYTQAEAVSGVELLATATASASATLDFVSLITSTYDRYTFVLKDLRFANASSQELWMRTSTNNGSSYDSAANAYGGVYRTRLYGNNPPTTTEVGQVSGATEVILGISGGNASTAVISGIVDLINPLGTVAYKRIIYNTIGGTQANERHYEGSSTRKSTADIDAVRFMSASGNITSGEIDMYGWRA